MQDKNKTTHKEMRKKITMLVQIRERLDSDKSVIAFYSEKTNKLFLSFEVSSWVADEINQHISLKHWVIGYEGFEGSTYVSNWRFQNRVAFMMHLRNFKNTEFVTMMNNSLKKPVGFFYA